MSYRLESKRLYIADLARRQHEMEMGRVAMQPLAYRVLSRRLRDAMAGLPDAALRAGFVELPAHLMPLVAEMAETRHFDHHGRLFGAWAEDCRRQAALLLQRARAA